MTTEGPAASPDKPKTTAKEGCLSCLGCLGVIAVICIVISLVTGGSSGDKHDSSPAAAVTSSAAIPDLATGDPADSADNDTTTDAAGQVVEWYGGGQTYMDSIVADLIAVSGDGSGADLDALTVDCGTLGTDVSAAQQYGPIPDDEAQTHWGSALSDLGTAASDCSRGASSVDSDLISRAGTEISSANSELTLAATRVQELSAGM